jgi:hypothetical protein
MPLDFQKSEMLFVVAGVVSECVRVVVLLSVKRSSPLGNPLMQSPLPTLELIGVIPVQQQYRQGKLILDLLGLKVEGWKVEGWKVEGWKFQVSTD